jgi:hypothetical protein
MKWRLRKDQRHGPINLLLPALLLVLLAGGCSGPDAEDYASAARQHARLAEEHHLRSQQHQDAARVLVREGDEVGAGIIQDAATADEWAARREMIHYHKDVWISDWMRAVSRPPSVACSGLPASPDGYPSNPSRRRCG